MPNHRHFLNEQKRAKNALVSQYVMSKALFDIIPCLLILGFLNSATADEFQHGHTSQSIEDSQTELPNIVYINADDLGYMDINCYAKEHLTETYYETPNLDKLAASGIRFTNGYAASANCAPSRCCFMTGQWPQRHGVYTVGSSERGNAKDRKLIPTKNGWFLSEKDTFVSEVLKEAGYTTAHFGKWHLTKDDPTHHGFDYNYGGNKSGSPTKGGYHSPYHYPNVVCDKKGQYLTDRLAQEAVNFIKQHKKKGKQAPAADKGRQAPSLRPFFIHFTPYSVHTPIQAKAALQKKYQKKSKTKHHKNPSYAAMVQSLDEAVGRIIDTLEKENLLHNTLIVFTSDNGGVDSITDNFPLRAGKGSYYEGGIREPFLFSWKGQISPNQINHTPITHLDLFPTFLATSKNNIPNSLDGRNLLPLLRDNAANKRHEKRTLYWHFPIYLQAYKKNDKETRDPLFRTRPGSTIRQGDWKLHHFFEDNALELYNLKDDLSEQNNLAATNPEKAKELFTLLDKWRKETNAPIPTKPNPKYKAPQ